MPEFKSSQGKIRYKNYIETPKEDGYRGYHLIGSFPDAHGNKKNIEIQLRTTLQHYWATALEIVDLFTGQALKSNQGDEDWKRFFFSVGEQFSIMENIHLFNALEPEEQFRSYVAALNTSSENISSCESAQQCCSKLDVITKLDAFAASLQIIGDKIIDNPDSGYVLLKINIDTHTLSSALFDKEENKLAEAQYLEAEKESAEKNGTVVALVSTTAVGGIKEAYPNYFADSTEFLKRLFYINEATTTRKKGFFNTLFGIRS
jgi:hypothetical protein